MKTRKLQNSKFIRQETTQPYTHRIANTLFVTLSFKYLVCVLSLLLWAWLLVIMQLIDGIDSSSKWNERQSALGLTVLSGMLTFWLFTHCYSPDVSSALSSRRLQGVQFRASPSSPWNEIVFVYPSFSMTADCVIPSSADCGDNVFTVDLGAAAEAAKAEP